MFSKEEKLKQQIRELKSELARQKRNNELLKKRTVQAVIDNTDASSRCEADRKLCEVARNQAEQASRIKSIFLENVSHEIRSSMSGVAGMLDLVLETEITGEQQFYLELVRTSADRLMVAVNEIIDFSRIETGELELDSVTFDIRESLDHNLYVLNQEAGNKGLELTCTINSDVPDCVYGDGERLVQIITNLVKNSIKYTERGSISIFISNNGYSKTKELLLKFEVTDTGCGIGTETLIDINNYFRDELKNKMVLPLAMGTSGVGLTVISQLVKIMGGEIGVRSDDTGTSFWFILPFKEVVNFSAFKEEAKKEMENIREESVFALRDAKILLAEDDYIHKTLIEKLLSRYGVKVISVQNGLEAVKQACHGSFDLILMDIQMDVMNGFEATRKIRNFESENNKKKRTPIIALTALSRNRDRKKCLRAGMDYCLLKPVDGLEFVETLSRFLIKKVLVVDSDPESQSLFLRKFVEAGWQVTIAEEKRSTMYEVCVENFDLILVDIDNDNLKGIESIKIIRQLEEYSGQRAKIVALGKRKTEKNLSLDVDNFLERPVTADAVALLSL